MNETPDFYNRGALSQVAHKEQIMKGLYGDDIFKGGVGSGRKISLHYGANKLGNTESGKPVFASKEVSENKDFTKEDHQDAAEIHATHEEHQEERNQECTKNGNLKSAKSHSDKADFHKRLAEAHRKEAQK